MLAGSASAENYYVVIDVHIMVDKDSELQTFSGVLDSGFQSEDLCKAATQLAMDKLLRDQAKLFGLWYEYRCIPGIKN
jgi:hypothetical protein